MIAVDRGPEPARLIVARRRHLSRQLLGRQQGKPPKITGYECARSALYIAQGRKCIYCERYTGEKGEPVEHFRPKDIYWWLAWTWGNLLFSCQSCNSGYKKAMFPVMLGTDRLPAPSAGMFDESSFKLSTESPLLIDPGSEDPLEHIEWRPSDCCASLDSLSWRPIHKSARGERTIKELGLRGTLLDHVNDHLRSHVVGRLKPLWLDCDRGAVDEMREKWEALLLDLFPRTTVFHAATYDALRFLVPRWFRERWRLSDPPRPGARVPSAPPAPVFQDPSLLVLLPSALQIAIRAELPPKIDLLEKLWPLRAWSRVELAEVLNLKPKTIGRLLEKLKKAGRLPCAPLAL